KPDPLRPQLVNGGFEEILREENGVKYGEGWHYMRQATLVENPAEAPEGQKYIQCKNEEPGRGSQALQGFAIDGRKVGRLAVRFSARGKTLRPGQDDREWPYVAFTFYDERRAALNTARIGPFRDSFGRTRYDEVIDVPVHAREAIIRI